jgi:hypothetical protein
MLVPLEPGCVVVGEIFYVSFYFFEFFLPLKSLKSTSQYDMANRPDPSDVKYHFAVTSVQKKYLGDLTYQVEGTPYYV